MKSNRVRSVAHGTRARRISIAISTGVASAMVMVCMTSALAAPSPAPGSVPPAQDPFYTAPANIASYAPGQIVASRPVTLNLSTPNNAWQIAYRTEDSHGNPEMTVTTLVVPRAPWAGTGTRPAVSFGSAEDSTGSQCAPSYWMAVLHGGAYDLDLNTMLSKGWAVADPDYEGPKSAWMAGPQAGHATLDGIRAADQFLPGGLSASTRWGIDGYSGGANAAAWAAQLQPTYAPDVHLVGVAQGATPADPKATAEYLDGGLFSGFEAAAAWGIDQDYPEMDLPSIENAAGQHAFAEVGNECLVSILLQFPFRKLTDYTTVPDPLDVPSVAAALAQDTPGYAAPTSAPIYDYHADDDEIVPVPQDNTLVQDWCQRGATIQVVRVPNLEHILELFAGEPGVLTFLSDRFDGDKPIDNC